MAGIDQTTPDSPASNSRLRSELLLALGLLLFGLVILPALIYLVGTFLLGPYSGGGRLGSFYGDLIRDLGGGSGRAWILIVGPLLLVQLGRVLFFRFGTGTGPPSPPRTKSNQKLPAGGNSSRTQPDVRDRREPTIKF